jgi:hypothetical protein
MEFWAAMKSRKSCVVPRTKKVCKKSVEVWVREEPGPCPVCGGDWLIAGEGGSWWVSCIVCFLTGSSSKQVEKAISIWNRLKFKEQK